ncbi:asparagine synthase (glutamine-hydrolyzing) [Burkholderia sp. L27(2015)]|uniref:asparagine synthase (glutamine-hydrolyzing) n=1 Tax=Burkholderia sp. L27(2015) TaxID=1641858 RepID=UPI00131E7391|nr:asparagine synthase (glutamine-hydrolyzing) [Burkholderia sp. L27(2015)]
MCGISGVISPNKVHEADASIVRQMNQRLEHRGPDSEGIFASERVMLAMRRLSIIDLAGGKQPLFNETQDIAIVCNGEIYNHHELRVELEALGHRFSSHSDVETIVHAYEEYGIECLGKLRGMFAFALWDAKKDKLLLARDRMGEKPLYIHRDGTGRLWFSSELRSLRAAMKAPPRLTAEAFNLFLTFQYIPEPATLLEGVEVLPAGHYLELTPGETNGASRPYWDLSHAHEDPSQPVAVTEEILDNACRLMGSADVPVAVALSGGIDSSLVAALTARHYPGQLHAFTIGYEGRPDTDERGFAASLAKELGIGFTEVELSTQDVIDGFPALMAAMDTPIGDIAAFGYYSVCQAAREAGYPVLLSGMGGDEFFWGYEWVREAVTRNEAILAGNVSKPSWWQRIFGKKADLKPDFFGVHPDLRNGDAWSRALMPASVRDALPAGFWLDQAKLDLSRPVHQAVSDLLNRTWLRSNCLALVDRMSMAHSVEVRLPLLDVDLVDRVTGMRNDGLVDWTKPHKWLLVEALRDALPADVLARKKQGFTPPVRDWLKGIVKRFAPLLANGALVRQGLLDPERARGNLSEFDLPFLYKLTLIECWVRLHLEGQSAEELLNWGTGAK